LVVVLIVAGVLAATYFSKPENSPALTESPSVVQPAELGYLQTSSGNLTKIFLVSANASYEDYPADVVQQWNNETVVQKGEPCFVLNLTLRNDYALTDSIEPAQKIPILNYTGFMWMKVSVSLFDKDGNQVNATDITHADVPFPSAGEFSIHSGDIKAVDVVLATSNRNIDHYKVTLWYLGILPYP
jgi:hypothetical protein